jgi:hypothetical protein
MVIIRFPDEAQKRQALGLLIGRFSGKSWATGELMVPPEALPHLATRGIKFSVEGLPDYHKAYASLRDSAAAAVQ